MSRTYAYLVGLAQEYAARGARLLDFGCGAGQIVAQAVAAGFDALGVDTYEQVWEQYGAAAGSEGGRILRILPGAALPLASASVDIAISNQVFEHIEDLGPVVAELGRVIRPGGYLIACFPTLEILREPHLRAPLVHRFRNGSRAQSMAMHASHLLGLCNAPDMNRHEWVFAETTLLRENVFYRDEARALEAFAPLFRIEARREPDFMLDRCAQHRLVRHVMPVLRAAPLRPLLRRACVRLAGVLVVFRRVEKDQANGSIG